MTSPSCSKKRKVRELRMACARPACFHCGERRTVYRRRGLCFGCYHKHEIRRQYAAKVDAIADFEGDAPDPRPVIAMPGSPEKVRELMERAQGGESLWSPYDACCAVNLN
jgi:hypothetical protein